MSPRAMWTIAVATLHEALRRRILFAAVGFGSVFVLLFGFGFAAVRREIMLLTMRQVSWASSNRLSKRVHSACRFRSMMCAVMV